LAFMAERWIGEPEWIARPPKEEGLVELMVGRAKAGSTAARVLKMIEALILMLGWKTDRKLVMMCLLNVRVWDEEGRYDKYMSCYSLIRMATSDADVVVFDVSEQRYEVC
jgi:hypothetical protein